MKLLSKQSSKPINRKMNIINIFCWNKLQADFQIWLNLFPTNYINKLSFQSSNLKFKNQELLLKLDLMQTIKKKLSLLSNNKSKIKLMYLLSKIEMRQVNFTYMELLKKMLLICSLSYSDKSLVMEKPCKDLSKTQIYMLDMSGNFITSLLTKKATMRKIKSLLPYLSKLRFITLISPELNNHTNKIKTIRIIIKTTTTTITITISTRMIITKEDPDNKTISRITTMVSMETITRAKTDSNHTDKIILEITTNNTEIITHITITTITEIISPNKSNTHSNLMNRVSQLLEAVFKIKLKIIILDNNNPYQTNNFKDNNNKDNLKDLNSNSNNRSSNNLNNNNNRRIKMETSEV